MVKSFEKYSTTEWMFDSTSIRYTCEKLGIFIVCSYLCWYIQLWFKYIAWASIMCDVYLVEVLKPNIDLVRARLCESVRVCVDGWVNVPIVALCCF